MPSAKNKRAKKVIDSSISAVRNLKTEIRWTERKMNKLLARHESGAKRWKQNINSKTGRIEKTELTKNQGIASNSKRHKSLLSHIESMKSRLKELGK